MKQKRVLIEIIRLFMIRVKTVCRGFCGGGWLRSSFSGQALLIEQQEKKKNIEEKEEDDDVGNSSVVL